MKKATVLAAALAAFAIVSTEANAQSATTPATPQPQTEQEQTPTTQQAEQQTQQTQTEPQGQEMADNKQQITKEELPEAAQQTLESPALQEWQISEVYKVAGDAAEANAAETYEVYLTNADQKRAVVRFDKEGKAVKNSEEEQPETKQ